MKNEDEESQCSSKPQASFMKDYSVTVNFSSLFWKIISYYYFIKAAKKSFTFSYFFWKYITKPVLLYFHLSKWVLLLYPEYFFRKHLLFYLNTECEYSRHVRCRQKRAARFLKHQLFSHASVCPASGMPAGLQPLPPGRPLSLAARASAGQALSPAASLQCPPLPALPAGRRTLGTPWWVRRSRLCLSSDSVFFLNAFTLLFLAPSSGDCAEQPSSSQRVEWWRSGGDIPALPGEHCQRDIHSSARTQLAELLAPHGQCVHHVVPF